MLEERKGAGGLGKGKCLGYASSAEIHLLPLPGKLVAMANEPPWKATCLPIVSCNATIYTVTSVCTISVEAGQQQSPVSLASDSEFDAAVSMSQNSLQLGFLDRQVSVMWKPREHSVLHYTS